MPRAANRGRRKHLDHIRSSRERRTHLGGRDGSQHQHGLRITAWTAERGIHPWRDDEAGASVQAGDGGGGIAAAGLRGPARILPTEGASVGGEFVGGCAGSSGRRPTPCQPPRHAAEGPEPT